jgi:hypothetical protein
MRIAPSTLLCTGVLLLAAGGAAATTPLAAKKLSLTGPGKARIATAAFDCSAARPLPCGQSVDSTNVGALNRVGAYACVEFDESGGDVVYHFTLADEAEIRLRLEGMQADLDLFLLGGCSGEDCLGSSAGVESEEIRRCLPAGTYWVVVDGFAGEASSFTLSLDCGACTPCEPSAAHDLCGAARPIPAMGLYTDAGSTACAADDYGPGSCTGYSALGRDVVYRIDLPPACTVRMTLRDGPDGVILDRSLYLATSCADPRGTCVAGADEAVEADEVLTYRSNTGGTFYLIVDSFGNSSGGDYRLEVERIDCSTVAVQPASWQQVKTLFR